MSGSRPAPATRSTTLWPDADRTRVAQGIDRSATPTPDCSARTPRSCLRAARNTGIDARASRDAGSYLCNYLSWRAIEAVDKGDGLRLASFVHVPLLARDDISRPKGFSRITLEELVDAGEAMLLEMVKLRGRRREFHRAGKTRLTLLHPGLTLPPTIDPAPSLVFTVRRPILGVS